MVKRMVVAAALAGSLAILLTPGRAAAQDAPDEGNAFTNLFRYGGTTRPSAAPEALDAAYCPTIDVSDGGAALQARSGGGGGDLRSQITLGNLARECAPRPDGSVVLRVGVEGRALLGPGGSPGRFNAPVHIAIKYQDKVVLTRSRQVAVTVPPGAIRGDFAFVEEGIAIPAQYARDYEIEVGLGGGGRPAAARAPRSLHRRGKAPAEGQG